MGWILRQPDRAAESKVGVCVELCRHRGRSQGDNPLHFRENCGGGRYALKGREWPGCEDMCGVTAIQTGDLWGDSELESAQAQDEKRL